MMAASSYLLYWILITLFITSLVVGVTIKYVNVSDLSFPYLQDWCPMRELVMNRTLSLLNSLRGREINIGILNLNSKSPLMVQNEISLFPTSGFVVDVYSAVASDMGFKINWVVLPSNNEINIFYKDPYYRQQLMLLPYVQYVDLVNLNGINTINEQRLGLGIRFTTLANNQFILIVNDSSRIAKTLWNFTIPFNNELWMLLIFTLIFNGVMFYLYRSESHHNDADHRTIKYSLYESLNAFAADKPFEHQNKKLMILSTGFNFLLLILLSSCLYGKSCFCFSSDNFS